MANHTLALAAFCFKSRVYKQDVRTTGCEVLCCLVGGVFAWRRLLMVEERKDLSHA